MLHVVGHRVKIHKVVTVVGNELGDTEPRIKDYVVWTHGEVNSLTDQPLLLDVTSTHVRYGRTTVDTNGRSKHNVLQ